MPRFGWMEIEGLIGSGGLTEVFRGRFAEGPRAGWPVAIKRLRTERAQDPAAVRSFLAEGEASRHLKHPNLVEVYETGTLDGIRFISMELVEGSDLLQILRRAAELGIDLPVDFCCFLAASIAEGLDHAHRARGATGKPLAIVHGDLSPCNVIVSKNGEVKVGDFGVARAEGGTEGSLGKVGYASPEQLRGEPVTPASDIYALGLLTYELLTRRRAFPAEEPEAALALMSQRPPPPSSLRPDIPPEIDAVILDALEPGPSARTPSAGEFAARLRRGFDHQVGTPLAIAALVRGLFHGGAHGKPRARPKTVALKAARPVALASGARPPTAPTPRVARPPTLPSLARPATRGQAQAAKPPSRATSVRPATKSPLRAVRPTKPPPPPPSSARPPTKSRARPPTKSRARPPTQSRAVSAKPPPPPSSARPPTKSRVQAASPASARPLTRSRAVPASPAKPPPPPPSSARPPTRSRARPATRSKAPEADPSGPALPFDPSQLFLDDLEAGPESPLTPVPLSLAVPLDLFSDHQLFVTADKTLEGGGIFVSTPLPLPIGTEVVLQLVVFRRLKVELRGKVAWARQGPMGAKQPHGVGVVPIGPLPDDLRKALTRLLTERPPMAQTPPGA